MTFNILADSLWLTALSVQGYPRQNGRRRLSRRHTAAALPRQQTVRTFCADEPGVAGERHGPASSPQNGLGGAALAIAELERQQDRNFTAAEKAIIRKRGEHRYTIPDGSRWGAMGDIEFRNL